MATNNFKPFGIGAGANVTSQADYEALAALLTGFQSGKASSAQINKALRQSTVMASVLAQFISDSAGVDVLDNGNTASILANLKSGMTALTPGRLLNVQTITTSGTYTKTPGAKHALIRAVGGGAGGGGVTATSSATQSTAKGGESGAYIEAYVDLSSVTSLSAIIGAGGVGAIAGSNSGTSGGKTSLGSLISCPGGEPGIGGNTSAASFVSSDRASNKAPMSTGMVLVSTPTSLPNLGRVANPSAPTVGGTGGSNPLGMGGAAGGAVPGTPANPTNATGYGSGGGGGASVGGNAAMGGANGAPGVIIIMEYA
ncbi:hypothetical protein ACS6JN_02795 [Enterobacter hormaechei subsp. steigerwaltii]|uniref:glycine-rich domain-containing protein n=1 Tax=Enterobacter hormaechei TaxID=158836 RepID=UPI003F424CA5